MQQALDHPGVQLVVNLTIPAAHAEVASAAIAAGKHVWNEKPLAPDVAAGRALLDQAAAAGVRVGCAPDTVLGAGIQSARRLIASGAIGTPISALTLLQGPGPESWHPDPEFLFAQGRGAAVRPRAVLPVGAGDAVRPGDRVAAVGRKGRDTRVIGSGPRAGTEFSVEVPTYISALAAVRRRPGRVDAVQLGLTAAPVWFRGDHRDRRHPGGARSEPVRRRPAGAPGGRRRVDRGRLARGGGGTRQRRGRHGPRDPARASRTAPPARWRCTSWR